MSVPKIIFFFPGFNSGGIERVTLNLADEFLRRGMDVTLLVLRAEGPLRSQVPDGARVVGLGGGNLYYRLPAVVKTLRRERPDAVLTSSTNINNLALLARRLSGVKTRIVISEHNHFQREEEQRSRRLSVRFRDQLRRRLYPWADGIAAVSAGVANSLRAAGIAAGRIQVIHNPIYNLALLEKAEELPGHAWFAGGAADEPVALAVGRLAAQKDYPTLLRAFAALLDERPARLVILGEGPDRGALEGLVDELGLESRVALLGYVPNPYAYMAHSKALVLSSTHEGFANVLVEAMACGTQVVSTDCPSGPAEILENGRYGRLAPVGDARGLAKAIGQALDAPISAEALRRRAADFSVEAAAQRYLALLLPEQGSPA